MRKRPLLLFACMFLTGLAYQRYENPWLICILLWSVVQEFYHGISKKMWKSIAGRSVFLLSAFLFGILHMQGEEAFRNTYLSKLEDGSSAVVWGEIKKIEQTDYSFRLILSDCYISLEDEVIPCNDVMVYTSSNHFQVGEIHKITGKVNRFQQARNQGNFDGRVFYESQKIDLCIYEEESVRLGENKNVIRDILSEFKQQILQVYEHSMETEAAGFFSAMVLGDKNGLDEHLKELFQVGGITHILAISGLHVSILGRGAYKWMRKWRWSFLFAGIASSLVLLAYCYMVGYGMSAIRAVGMMLLFFMAQYLGRSYDMLNSLGAMCILLLFENPFFIEYSGFWFSVTALVGVGFVGPALTTEHGNEKVSCKKIGWRAMFGKLLKNNDLWMSLGITLTSLPVVAYCYYEIPIYSTLVNMIVLPVLPFVFVLAVVGGIIGLFAPGLAGIVLIPCSWVFSSYKWLCSIVAELPWASMITGAPSKEQMVVYYMVLLVGVLFIKHLQKKARNEEDTNKQGVQLLLTVLCISIICFPREKQFEITFLDVGQGDGIYISAGDGTTYFVDGGSSNISSVGEYRILPFLKYKGISQIDYWFVSHADTDHISGLLEVLESGYRINHLVVAEYCPRDENYESIIQLAELAKVEVIHMKAGDSIVSKNSSMTCLYPTQEGTEDRNDLSMVLLLQAEIEDGEGLYSALFTGDCSAEVEELLLEKNLLLKENMFLEENTFLQVDLFKAAHHGSNYSNSEELLSALRPSMIVVSCSSTNTYGHPGAEAVARMEQAGAEVYYTMKNGQVTMLGRDCVKLFISADSDLK